MTAMIEPGLFIVPVTTTSPSCAFSCTTLPSIGETIVVRESSFSASARLAADCRTPSSAEA